MIEESTEDNKRDRYYCPVQSVRKSCRCHGAQTGNGRSLQYASGRHRPCMAIRSRQICCRPVYGGERGSRITRWGMCSRSPGEASGSGYTARRAQSWGAHGSLGDDHGGRRCLDMTIMVIATHREGPASACGSKRAAGAFLVSWSGYESSTGVYHKAVPSFSSSCSGQYIGLSKFSSIRSRVASSSYCRRTSSTSRFSSWAARAVWAEVISSCGSCQE